MSGYSSSVYGDDTANTFNVGSTGDNGRAGVVFDGRGGDDVLTGSAGNDFLYGGAGNDLLAGRGGSDALDGGAGIDRANYTGLYRTYAPSTVAGVTTLHGGADEGTDTIQNVEHITFKDGELNSDPNSVGAQIIRIYDTVLGRAPDRPGLDAWVDQMEDRGAMLSTVAGAIAGSPEFQAITGGLGNGAFVDYVYLHALGRSADASGRAAWTGALDGGLSRGDMLVGFSESTEHRAKTEAIVAQGYFQSDDSYQSVALLYDSFAGRLPDAPGLTAWSETVKSGALTLNQVADDFAASDEFTSATNGMNNGQLVDFMYQNTLDRSPDAAGRAFWTDQLDHSLSKGALLYEFSQSAEHANLLAANIVGGIVIA